MAAWKLLVRELAIGDGAPVSLTAAGYAPGAIRFAELQGLIRRTSNHDMKPGEPVFYVLGDRGLDYFENRITQVERRPGGHRWVLTWLSALPRDITITHPGQPRAGSCAAS